ncbi:beta-1,3-glucan-binding protein-like [Schistocerca nitens]|uniref:beta-1,3-glucan-binding protein-like n=1 Tax=Schistocerca nitens TaxID=7011 RepID=UPI0021192F2B|nr:beta-1,3-glucan-binding protein-like [Schistocerca nitens]
MWRLLLAAAVAAAAAAAAAREILVWRDEFDTLDPAVWDHLVTGSRGYNSEFQYYRNSRQNSYVRDGVLYIRPTLTADERGEKFLYSGTLSDPACNLSPCVSKAGSDIVTPLQSARIRTIKSFSFRYGRIEVRAKMPRGDWLWPAIWLKPARNEYGGWPASGEIDLVECRSNRKLTTAAGASMGVDHVGATLHFGPNSSYNVWRQTHWMATLSNGRDFADDFHLYGMVWTRNSISFTIDHQLIGSISAPAGGFWRLGGFEQNPGGNNIWRAGDVLAPFDKEFFIIMNVAVGGKFFPDGWRNFPRPKPWNWTSAAPMRDFWERRHWWQPTWRGEDAALRVDYVRVFAFPYSSVTRR